MLEPSELDLCFGEREEPGVKEKGSTLLRCVLQVTVGSRANPTRFTFVQLNAVRTDEWRVGSSWPLDSWNVPSVEQQNV